jgi:hypothetical protein
VKCRIWIGDGSTLMGLRESGWFYRGLYSDGVGGEVYCLHGIPLVS